MHMLKLFYTSERLRLLPLETDTNAAGILIPALVKTLAGERGKRNSDDPDCVDDSESAGYPATHHSKGMERCHFTYTL